MDQDRRTNDELLVLGALEGDSGAFGKLVEQWQERLWRHARRLTGDDEGAWDVLQETWIGVIRGLRGLDDVSLFPAWVYRIATNKSRDWIRRRARRQHATDAYGEGLEQTTDDPSRRVEQHEDLKDALAALSGSDRAILALRYEEEFSTAEIAAILALPQGTVKSRLHYARERLRELLKEKDDE